MCRYYGVHISIISTHFLSIIVLEATDDSHSLVRWKKRIGALNMEQIWFVVLMVVGHLLMMFLMPGMHSGHSHKGQGHNHGDVEQKKKLEADNLQLREELNAIKSQLNRNQNREMQVALKQKIVLTAGYITVSLFILSLSVAITINFTPLYAFDIDYLNIPKYVGLSKEQILENYRILLTYLNIPWFLALDMPDFPSSAIGLFHFFEVKKLFMLDYLIFIFSGMGTLWFVRHLNRRRESWRILPYFRRGTLIPLAILLALLVSFDTLFVLFHQVFFNNDAWLFNATTDPIILALPAEFFMHSFLLAFGLIEVFLILGYFTTKYRISAPSR